MSSWPASPPTKRSGSIGPNREASISASSPPRRHWCDVPAPAGADAATSSSGVPGLAAHEGDENLTSRSTSGVRVVAPSDSMAVTGATSESASTTTAASTTRKNESASDGAPSTAALASRSRDHGSNRGAKDGELPLFDHDDSSGTDRDLPLQVVYCEAPAANSPSRALLQKSPHDRQAPHGSQQQHQHHHHPLSMVEQYVRCYALNLPSPTSKAKRKTTSRPTPTRRDGASARTPPAAAAGLAAAAEATPTLSPSSTAGTTTTATAASSSALLPPSSKWSGARRPATSSPATHRRRLRAAASAAVTAGGAIASASVTSASTPSPRSHHHPVLLSRLDGPSVTASDVWEQAHDDSGTRDDALFTSGTAVGAGSARFHEMDPATVKLLGDRKRYRVDVDASNPDDPEATLRNPSPSATSSYSIRIVHELTGRVGSTVPVATLVAHAASSPMHHDRDDTYEYEDSDPGIHDVKRRKVMSPTLGYEDGAEDAPPGSCPLHSALTGVCSAVKKAKDALMSPPRPPRTTITASTSPSSASAAAAAAAAPAEPELQRSERGRLV